MPAAYGPYCEFDVKRLDFNVNWNAEAEDKEGLPAFTEFQVIVLKEMMAQVARTVERTPSLQDKKARVEFDFKSHVAFATATIWIDYRGLGQSVRAYKHFATLLSSVPDFEIAMCLLAGCLKWANDQDRL